jgi:hypothetical protein
MAIRIFSRSGQPHGHDDTAIARARREHGAAAVRLRDLAHDREAEAGALGIGRHAVEPLEHVRPRLGRNAGAVVDHVEHDRAAVAARGDRHAAARLRVAHRVVDEVRHQRAQQAVAAGDVEPLAEIRAEVDRAPLREHDRFLQHARHDGREIDALREQRRRRGFRMREQQQLVGHVGHLAAAALHAVEHRRQLAVAMIAPPRTGSACRARRSACAAGARRRR